MKRIENWIIKQDFIDLLKKISFIETPLFIALITVSVVFLGEKSLLLCILSILTGSAFLSLLYVIPIKIHQSGKRNNK